MSAAIIAAVSVIQASASRGTCRSGHSLLPGGITISQIGEHQYHLTLSLTVADSQSLNMPDFIEYIGQYRKGIANDD